MEKLYKGMSSHEVKEAERFDRTVRSLYSKPSDLIVEPVHWEKFNNKKFIHQPYAFVIQSMGDLTGKKVLEMGCGTGIFSLILVKRGAVLVDAFDISMESIKIAHARAQVNNVEQKINFRAISVYDINYLNDDYDFIVGMNILHHIDIEKIVEKIFMLLKPGGEAYFLEPFGNVRWFEKLRLMIPVKVNEEDKSHWQGKLKYKDVEKFKVFFNNVEGKEFHLFSRLDRVVRSSKLINFIARCDEWVLKEVPYMRRYARKIVISLRK